MMSLVYRNILVISDNSHLCREFENLISELELEKLNWVFSISPFSNLSEFKAKLKNEVSIRNLKEHSTVVEICKDFDLVFSIHCKQIFPKLMVKNIKCINVHPGYNPINRGWYPQVFAIVNELPIGATIHEIDEELDHGEIIDRKFVKKSITDTSLSLYSKVISMEIQLLKKNLLNILQNDYKTLSPDNKEGNLFLKKDFNELCKIDLSRNYQAKDFINLLRALTHGEYSNAYFVNPGNNRKVFVTIRLEEEE
ncbi:MAG: hypothetical protein CMB99_06510 [Flavobacteriaceae bacterium]|nr:hypothetical protein [Flavobacteriaceae bacterium]|tara:strand:- start:15484 stop:16242 length:759 start_codon:yes stop_codon:yes gene_type:complete